MPSHVDLLLLRDHLITKGRYFLPKKFNKILEIFLEGAKHRTDFLQKTSEFWRARKLPNDIFSKKPLRLFSCHEMTAPNSANTKANRITSKGIPCLFLSSDKKTAAVETRPWLGVNVQVAKFILQKKQKIIDLTKDVLFGNELREAVSGQRDQEQLTRELKIWQYLNVLYARPVDVGGEDEYIFTQFIADLFKVKGGFDGIKYMSSVSHRGFNLALFNTKRAKIEDEKSMDVKEVTRILWDMHVPMGPRVIDLKKYRDFEQW
ncbi:MAG: RES family NAD+ phosphorylase [Candidatus Omnitrophota bacterium]|jgi:hypothetical protein